MLDPCNYDYFKQIVRFLKGITCICTLTREHERSICSTSLTTLELLTFKSVSAQQNAVEALFFTFLITDETENLSYIYWPFEYYLLWCSFCKTFIQEFLAFFFLLRFFFLISLNGVCVCVCVRARTRTHLYILDMSPLLNIFNLNIFFYSVDCLSQS